MAGHRNLLITLTLAALPALPLQAAPPDPADDSMMQGRNGARVTPLFTVGETVTPDDGGEGYQPVGVLDGLGAYRLDADTVRLWVNHELADDKGRPYRLANGTLLRGARISQFDIDRHSRTLRRAGIAYAEVHDRAGQPVTRAEQINGPGSHGFDRFCSAALFEPNRFGEDRGFRDRIHFAGEERSRSPGGTLWAGEVDRGRLWAVPMLGRGAWENVAEIDTGTPERIALLLGDDHVGAPLYLYVGIKNGDPHSSFLDRNGLQQGRLYAWKSAGNDADPATFHGMAAQRDGHWVELHPRDPARAGQPGHDALGDVDAETLRAEADRLGAFSFSRPEDLHVNPRNGRQAVLASTGRADFAGGSDTQGDLYLIDLQFDAQGNPGPARLTLLYDGDADPALRLRSPDNLSWSSDGRILVQEDAAYPWQPQQNPAEARIVAIDPLTLTLTTLAEIHRAAVRPSGSSDAKAKELGAWESSGIIEVSSLFDAPPGTLHLFDVQAHGIRDGMIGERDLVEGGQLLWLEVGDPVSRR
ncbi:MAG TPA: DUF839 domain-containing protein [Pseudomonadales bacterium]|nr:DUF839 domain-containing protein [Pseudomonadales bacterium]HNH71490.1 DUF839 domain-containing protein [Pseudomonadales bacterium]HNL23584.1 DUF839 domain-containing protein [Pseudomonadales bacterium]